MPKIYLLLVISFITGCASSTPRTETSFKLRPYSQITLKNGLPVLLVPDSSLPFVSFQMLIKSGSTEDPVGQSGLASLVAETLDKGTKIHTAEQIADRFAFLGASFDSGVTEDYTSVSCGGLSWNLDEILKLYAEIITRPAFPQAEVQRVKNQAISRLKKAVDEPSYFAKKSFLSFLFGTHPYGRPDVGIPKEIEAIKQKQVIKYFLTHYHPGNALLAVTGNFDNSLASKLETALASWLPRKSLKKTFPDFVPSKGVSVLIADKPDLVQTQIRIGHRGIRRSTSDFLAVRLANLTLGGDFHSRLNNRVRKELGLTYNVSSYFEPRLDFGPFTISTFTRNEKVGETIAETLKVYQKFQMEGPTEQEFQSAKAFLKGQFPQAIETSEKLAMNLLLLRFYGVSDLYLSDFFKNLDRITLDEIKLALKTHFTPGDLKIFIYGPSAKIATQVQSLGNVQVKSYKEF